MNCIICGKEAVALFPKTARIANMYLNYGVGLCKEHLDSAMKLYDVCAEPEWLNNFITSLKESKEEDKKSE